MFVKNTLLPNMTRNCSATKSKSNKTANKKVSKFPQLFSPRLELTKLKDSLLLLLTQDESFKLKLSDMLVPQKKSVEMYTQTSSMDRLPTIPKEPLPTLKNAKSVNRGSMKLPSKADVESDKINFKNVLASFHESEQRNSKKTDEELKKVSL